MSANRGNGVCLGCRLVSFFSGKPIIPSFLIHPSGHYHGRWPLYLLTDQRDASPRASTPMNHYENGYHPGVGERERVSANSSVRACGGRMVFNRALAHVFNHDLIRFVGEMVNHGTRIRCIREILATRPRKFMRRYCKYKLENYRVYNDSPTLFLAQAWDKYISWPKWKSFYLTFYCVACPFRERYERNLRYPLLSEVRPLLDYWILRIIGW